MRISREQMYMDMAYTAAKRGTCGRLAVGAVLVKNRQQLFIGYGGAPSGQPHCEEFGCDLSLPCRRTLHAESNCIDVAKAAGVDTEGCELFTTDSPCIPCAEKIMEARISTIYFSRLYRDTRGIEKISFCSWIRIFHLLDNGMMKPWQPDV